MLREESTINKSDKVSPEILKEMVELRLIRREPRLGDNNYELTHDTLIDPILSSRQAREQRRRKYLNWGVAVVVTVVLLVVPGHGSRW